MVMKDSVKCFGVSVLICSAVAYGAAHAVIYFFAPSLPNAALIKLFAPICGAIFGFVLMGVLGIGRAMPSMARVEVERKAPSAGRAD
jgi:hypothetical protein